MLSQLLNGNQVAQILGISRSFAYQLMRHGQVPSVRIGRSIRVKVEDLEDFILANRISQNKNRNIPIGEGIIYDESQK